MKKKNRILVLGLTFSMLISSGSLTGCDSAAGNMGKETTGVEYEEADYELSEESCSDSGIDAADPGTVDNETEKTAENRTDAEKSTETEESQTDNSTDSGLWKKASTTPYIYYNTDRILKISVFHSSRNFFSADSKNSKHQQQNA